MTLRQRSLAGQHLVICNWRSSGHPRAGGAEQYCEEVALELDRLGATVTLLTSRPRGVRWKETTGFGTVVRLGGAFTMYVLVFVWLFWHRRKIDAVIDSQNGIPFFAPLAVGRRIPVVMLIHHVHQQQFALYLPPLAAFVGRVLEKQVARLVYGRRPVCVVSPSSRSEVRRQLRWKGPVVIAPNGVVMPSTARRGRSELPRIVCVGRLVPHKRYQLLLDVLPELFRQWPDLQVDIVGDGESRAALQEHALSLRLPPSLRFHGRLPEDQRDELISSAWITVNPSVGEGWGLSVIEAAALGVPAVAFNVPGLQDSVRHGDTGWLVDNGTALDGPISSALAELSDEGVADAWSDRCREWAAGFSWAATAARIAAVLATESDRLEGGLDNRRTLSDSSSIATVHAPMAPAAALAKLRRLDQIRVTGEHAELLLNNADEHDGRAALERIGMPDGAVVDVRLARNRDLLGWFPIKEPLVDAPSRSTVGEPDRRVVPMRRRMGRPARQISRTHRPARG